MPDFDGKELLNIIEELVKLEARWIPPLSEYSLYIRPFQFSIDDALGVKKPDRTKLMVVLSPVGPYYATGFKPISLFCATKSIRSAPKGTGSYKLGGYDRNYAATTDRPSAPPLTLSLEVISKSCGSFKIRLSRSAPPISSSSSRTKTEKLKSPRRSFRTWSYLASLETPSS
jgi:hypothetical protein